MNKTILISMILVGVVIVSLGVYSAVSVNSKAPTANVIQDKISTDSSANADVKIIRIKASAFEYSPSVITVTKGDYVRIIIENVDTAHGISISGYNVRGIDSVEFVADKVGEFSFRCPTFCGAGHREMEGKLIVQ